MNVREFELQEIAAARRADELSEISSMNTIHWIVMCLVVYIILLWWWLG